MEDNLRILDLIKYNEKKYHRAQEYLYWTYIINKIYNFVENIDSYKRILKNIVV